MVVSFPRSSIDDTLTCRRVENRQALEAQLTELTKRRTQEEWISKLKEVSTGRGWREMSSTDLTSPLVQVGVPCGQVNDIAQAFADPQLHHRQMFMRADHAALGTQPSA